MLSLSGSVLAAGIQSSAARAGQIAGCPICSSGLPPHSVLLGVFRGSLECCCGLKCRQLARNECLGCCCCFLLRACRVNDAVAKAKEEWHHYTHCLELVG